MIMNKKVLLRECKRHTGSYAVSTRCTAPSPSSHDPDGGAGEGGGRGVTPSSPDWGRGYPSSPDGGAGVPHSVLTKGWYPIQS